MNTSRAHLIEGTFADIKSVKTRGVAQIVIEIPIQNAEHAIRLLGYPQPATEVHVAIARLKNGDGAIEEPAEPETPKQRLRDKSVGQQAALCCKDAVFRAYLREAFRAAVDTKGEAASWIRDYFLVPSRADIPADQWKEFHDGYTAWKALERAA